MRKTGDERFIDGDLELDVSLKDFWSWNQSDLLSNTLRGKLAEFIVGTAVDAVTNTRIEWDAYDLFTPDGIKIEVKSSSYLQSWKQSKMSSILFDICPTKGWESATNTYMLEVKRHADVYVFCLLKFQELEFINPLNMEQWTFFVLSTHRLNQEKEHRKALD